MPDSLKSRDILRRGVHLELVPHLVHTTNAPHSANQLRQLVCQDVATQGYSSLEGVHGNGTGMGDRSANRRADPLRQDLITGLILLKTGAKLRGNPRGAVSGIAGHAGKLVSDFMASVKSLVAKQRASPGAPLGIEQIHRTRSDYDSSDQLALASHVISPLSQTGGVRFRRLAGIPAGGSVERLDRARPIQVDQGVELTRKMRLEVVAQPLGFRSVDNADRPFQPDLIQLPHA
jgi:hypothetical protein